MSPTEALAQAHHRITAILEDEAKHADDAPAVVSKKTPSNPNEIVLWYYSHPLASDAFLPGGTGLAVFRDRFPDITLTPQCLGEWGVAVQKLMVSLAAGDVPDIALVKRDWLTRMADAGLLVALDSMLPRSLLDDLRPPIRQAFTIKGHLYGWPADGFCSVLVYNRSLVAEPPPTTWDGLKRAGSAAGRPDSDPRKSVFGLGDVPFLESFWSAGGEIGGSGSAGLDTPAASEALAFVLSLRAEGLASPVTLGNPDAAFSCFVNGQAAMTVTSSANWPVAQRAGFPTSVAPVPGKSGPVSRLSDDIWVIFAQCAEEKESAITGVLDFLSGEVVQGKEAAMKGSSPVRTSVRQHLAQEGYVFDGVDQAFLCARATPALAAWGVIEFELDQYLARAYGWDAGAE